MRRPHTPPPQSGFRAEANHAKNKESSRSSVSRNLLATAVIGRVFESLHVHCLLRRRCNQVHGYLRKAAAPDECVIEVSGLHLTGHICLLALCICTSKGVRHHSRLRASQNPADENRWP